MAGPGWGIFKHFRSNTASFWGSIMPHVAGTLGALTEEEAIEVLPTLQTLVLQRSEVVVSEADDLLKHSSSHANIPNIL